MILNELQSKNLIHPPSWLIDSTQYLCHMGSYAYGVSNDNSDIDLYGFCIPNKENIFPHLNGEILGFGKASKRFEQWQEHHIKDSETEKEYDFSLYGIVKYFDLCSTCNPNMIDSLFVPEQCIVYCSSIGDIVRENRKLFLHKGCYHKFKGYAYSQLRKMATKTAMPNSKRFKNIEQYGYDVKFAYHLVRLILEVEEVLKTGDLTLDNNIEILKSIWAGEWTQERVMRFFDDKEKGLDQLNESSTLPSGPNMEALKRLLLNCLEQHFGNLDNCITLKV